LDILPPSVKAYLKFRSGLLKKWGRSNEEKKREEISAPHGPFPISYYGINVVGLNRANQSSGYE
jgi:hypothetical protein